MIANLRKALSELRVQFDRWGRGEIDSFELNDLVHRFHQDIRGRSGKDMRPRTLSRPSRRRWLPECFAKRNCR